MPDLYYLAGYIGLLTFIILIFLWTRYNTFIKQRNQVKTDLSDVGVQVKRKADLIERLINITHEYASHEKGTLEGVTKARSALNNASGAHATAQAENMLTDTLKSLFMVVEAHPQLKASENYMSLSKDLTETENAIATYREEYNQTVKDYNTTIQTFPNLLAAMLFGFSDEELFQS